MASLGASSREPCRPRAGMNRGTISQPELTLSTRLRQISSTPPDGRLRRGTPFGQYGTGPRCIERRTPRLLEGNRRLPRPRRPHRATLGAPRRPTGTPPPTRQTRQRVRAAAGNRPVAREPPRRRPDVQARKRRRNEAKNTPLWSSRVPGASHRRGYRLFCGVSGLAQGRPQREAASVSFPAGRFVVIGRCARQRMLKPCACTLRKATPTQRASVERIAKHTRNSAAVDCVTSLAGNVDSFAAHQAARRIYFTRSVWYSTTRDSTCSR